MPFDDGEISPRSPAAGENGHRARRRSDRKSFASVRSSVRSVGSIADLHARAYEHFGGVDLEEPQEESGLPILGGSATSEIRKTSDMQTFMTLVKAFVGPAHLYLAKGLANAGIWVGLFSLFLCSALNAYCISLLIEVKQKVFISSYPQMGEMLFGINMRRFVDLSLCMSQLGLAAMYYIFVGETFRDAVAELADCEQWVVDVPMGALIGIQVIMQLPLSWIRQIKGIAFFAIIADVLIFAGMIWVICANAIDVAKNPFPDTKVVNSKYPMFFGSAVLCFEGIGVMLPIHEAMENPKNFIPLVWGAIMLCCTLFSVFAFVGYGARGGPDVQTNLLLAMPETTISQLAKLCYVIAVFLSFALQAFPAYRIIELASGMQSATKLQRNLLRSAVVVVLGAIAWGSANNLGNFVAVIGGVAMCPLAFIFPSLFHYKAAADTPRQKAIDLSIVAIGTICMLLTTGMAISEWIQGNEDTLETCLHNTTSPIDL
eukprot:TRINITY_DN19233_c0_g1_i1.p1 TRINITY_DN19233_c0_g1~~TRINITY_DN19233_c0_g1_i1.p1  ORF type:complete len:520 (+),score=190.45 TRINITY_DN19233_c0_g1_i1:102-1562(+)